MHPLRPLVVDQQDNIIPQDDVHMHDNQLSIPPEPIAPSTDELPAAVLQEDQQHYYSIGVADGAKAILRTILPHFN